MTRLPLMLALLLAVACFPSALWAQPSQPDAIPIAYVGETQSSAWLGVQQGVDELNLLGQFTGQRYTVQRFGPEELDRIAKIDPIAIVAAADAGFLERLRASFPDRAILNVTARDDHLRRLCRDNLLHVIPDFAMLRDAVAQWRKKQPGANVRAQAWHPEFQKYAGRELNNRFRKAHGVPMDSEAWAGWAAAKAVGESVLRSGGSTEPGRLIAYMRKELTFDAQKGMPVSFRPTTGQLRQPLLIVEKGKIVGEAPVAGVEDVENLDSLGMLDCVAPAPAAAPR